MSTQEVNGNVDAAIRLADAQARERATRSHLFEATARGYFFAGATVGVALERLLG